METSFTRINIKLLSANAKVPKIQREGDAAFDIYSCEDATIAPGETRPIDCGVAFEVPPQYKLMVNGRSGLASRGIFCHVGTIDSNYRGMVGTILYNSTKEPYTIMQGDRVGQVSLQAVVPTLFEVVEELSSTVRGDQKFGSSGK